MSRYAFEMTQKLRTREVVTRSNDIWALLHEAATALGPKPASGSVPKLSGARGEIEIGVEDGQQICIRVLD